MTDRRHLRTQFRKKRAAIPAPLRAEFNHAINLALQRYDALQHADSVAAYLATDGEVDLGEWIRTAWQSGKRVALPVVRAVEDNERAMDFRAWEPDTALEPNRYRIAEPVGTPAVTDLDAVLVPLVAFDRSGTRLGMGGGYYDAYLARSRARRIGVAFSCQQSAAPLPRAHWDVRLDAIVTELGIEAF